MWTSSWLPSDLGVMAKGTMELPRPLTDEEVARSAAQLAQTIDDRQGIVEEKKAAMAVWKERLGTLDDEITELARRVRERTEPLGGARGVG